MPIVSPLLAAYELPSIGIGDGIAENIFLVLDVMAICYSDTSAVHVS